MDDINPKNIRVLSSQLDLKGNNAKTLSDLVPQLQSNTIIKGLVVGSTAKGEIIFHTAIGRFISPNPLGLDRGDTITIRLASEGEQLTGTIFKVNNENSQTSEKVKLAFVKNDDAAKASGRNIAPNQTSSTNLTLENIDTIPDKIKGTITYLNLTKLDKQSLIYKTLVSHITSPSDKIPIELKLVQTADPINKALQITGQVASKNENGAQMVKVSFGIITTDNIKMPVGQNLNLEIISVNNKTITNNPKDELIDFIFHVNDKWPLLKKLLNSDNTPSSSAKNITPKIVLSDQEADFVAGAQSDLIDNESQPIRIDFNQTKGAAGSEQLTKAIATLSQNIELIPNKNLLTTYALADADQQSNTTASKQINTNNPNVALSELSAIDQLTMKLASSSSVLSSLRMNTRKLKSNLDEDFIKQHDIDLNEGFEDTPATDRKNEQLSTKTLNNILKDLSDLETVKKLAVQFSNLKDLVAINQKQQQDHNTSVTVMIPFYINHQLYEQEVNISRPTNDFIRILVNANFQMLGEIQFDGLVKFDSANKNLRSFDLVLRTKEKLDLPLQHMVNNIFLTNQNITGVRGNLAFEEDKKIH